MVGGICPELKAITLSTGGNCYFPSDLNSGINFFERETILCAGTRKKVNN